MLVYYVAIDADMKPPVSKSTRYQHDLGLCFLKKHPVAVQIYRPQFSMQSHPSMILFDRSATCEETMPVRGSACRLAVLAV
jgi:hypothetical protein